MAHLNENWNSRTCESWEHAEQSQKRRWRSEIEQWFRYLKHKTQLIYMFQLSLVVVVGSNFSFTCLRSNIFHTHNEVWCTLFDLKEFLLCLSDHRLDSALRFYDRKKKMWKEKRIYFRKKMYNYRSRVNFARVIFFNKSFLASKLC